MRHIGPWASSRKLPGLPKALPLGELSPKVTERARTLTKNRRRSDSIALPKRQLIAAWRLPGDGLALSVIASQCHCPGCGSQRLLRCRSHPAGRGPNSSSLFPPLAAVVAVAPKGRGFGSRRAQKYDLLRKYEQKPEKALPFPVPVCYNFLCLLQKPEVKQRSQEYDKKR